MKIRDLFRARVDRDIPPVVYFHEQSPQNLQAEVGEYIITGGWPKDHPNHKRVSQGIHESYVRLLNQIAKEMDKPGGPELPAVWISGFYGSGKSSFAKLLGLALDGKELPDQRSLARAWLEQDSSPLRHELVQAWEGLQQKVHKPLAVVFDIGAVSRGDEPIHSALIGQLQKRLGYCDKDPMVARDELRLERDGHYQRFLETVEHELGALWSDIKHTHMVADTFSTVLSVMFPKHYPEPTAWIASRAAQTVPALSAEDAAASIQDMLRFRADGRTLFVVIDEVSQYLAQDAHRVLALQSLVSSLGQRLKGQVWLLATGQQRLDEPQQDEVLGKMKDRFPPALRVHLGATNIRDVVHRRLLHKKPGEVPKLRALFAKYRSNLQLFGYGCQEITEDEFVEAYPLLPQHFDLLLQITSALRARSSTVQGEQRAIRGLLQMIGELFRGHRMGELPVGRLITLDQIYEVQASALDQEVQSTLARVMEHCASTGNELASRCVKAVALLELLQPGEGGLRTDAKLVARCVYEDMTQGSNEVLVQAALEQLHAEGFLGRSERNGYKIQSSAGQAWEQDRQCIGVPCEDLGALIQESLESLISERGERPRFRGRRFAWQGLFSDGNRLQDSPLRGARDECALVVDFRAGPEALGDRATWINQSAEAPLKERIIWVLIDYGAPQDAARELAKSRRMIKRYQSGRGSLPHDQRRLLLEEEARSEDLARALRKSVGDAYFGGRIYHNGKDYEPSELGASFCEVLVAAGNRCLPLIYSQLDATQVSLNELKQLLQRPMSGPDSKFYGDGLGILEEDAGQIVASCAGPIPKRVFEVVERDPGISGVTLLQRFNAPPYGYAAGVVKACVAGLLQAGKIRVRPVGDGEIRSVVDRGVQSLFEKDGVFRSADFFPAGAVKIRVQDRARIQKLFKTVFDREVAPENEAIADAVGEVLSPLGEQLIELERVLMRLPGQPETPAVIVALRKAVMDCLRERQVEPRLIQVKRHLAVLQEGVGVLFAYRSELRPEVIEEVRRAYVVQSELLPQLMQVGEVDGEMEEIAARVAQQLKQECPWEGISAIADDLVSIQEHFARTRERLIALEQARMTKALGRVKAQPGFLTLSADEQRRVLQPIQDAVTRGEGISLMMLWRGCDGRIADGERVAFDVFDGIEGQKGESCTVGVELSLQNRVVGDRQDLEVLLDEVRARLLEQLDGGRRARIRVD